MLRDEIVPKVGKVEIVSGYRDTALNACAGGARGSIHRKFGAFDLYPLDSGMTRAKLVPELCRWHKRRGETLRVGLGIYQGAKFHIDARSYRTWGPDYRRTSSPCEVE